MVRLVVSDPRVLSQYAVDKPSTLGSAVPRSESDDLCAHSKIRSFCVAVNGFAASDPEVDCLSTTLDAVLYIACADSLHSSRFSMSSSLSSDVTDVF